MERKIYLDFWYGDKIEKVDGLTITFYPGDGEYRGNMLINGEYIGDYSTPDSIAIEEAFPQLNICWY